jgi:hypothetical protein
MCAQEAKGVTLSDKLALKQFNEASLEKQSVRQTSHPGDVTSVLLDVHRVGAE